MSDDNLPAPAAYDASRLNAVQHGILARTTVLPWEDGAEYVALLESLAIEHAPIGPTEAHLVEEIAGVLWRKRRLRMAESATLHRGLHATTDSHRKTAEIALVAAATFEHKPQTRDAIKSTPAEIRSELADLEVDRQQTHAALAILAAGGTDAYDRALAVVAEDTRAAWSNQLTWEPGDYTDGAEPYQPDAGQLTRYLTSEILPWYDEERERLEAMPAVRAQALGDALDPDKLVSLGRYEVHLDRKFERTLSTLIRLQDLRRARTAPAPL